MVKLKQDWWTDTEAYCNKCEQWRPLSDFYPRKDTSRAPVYRPCGECHRTYRIYGTAEQKRKNLVEELSKQTRYCENGDDCVHAPQIGGPVKLRKRWIHPFCEQCHIREVGRNVVSGKITNKMVQEALKS